MKTPAPAGRRMVASGRRGRRGRELTEHGRQACGRRSPQGQRTAARTATGASDEEGPPPDAGERRTGCRPAHGRRPPQRQGSPLRRLTYPPRRERRRPRAGAAPARARPPPPSSGAAGLLRGRPLLASPGRTIRRSSSAPTSSSRATRKRPTSSRRPRRRSSRRRDGDRARRRPAAPPARASRPRSSRVATGLSRVLGLVREVVASYYFGAAGKINAFTIAFQMPNLVRALVADAALSSAFVPVFIDLLKQGQRSAPGASRRRSSG